MGSVFTGMGLLTMISPKVAAEMSLTKDFLGKDGVTPALKLVMQCFGSQASLCGLVILSSNFTARTYRNFGLAMIPYLMFDYHCWANNALTTFGALGDVAGNALFAACCAVGYKLLKDEKDSKDV